MTNIGEPIINLLNPSVTSYGVEGLRIQTTGITLIDHPTDVREKAYITILNNIFYVSTLSQLESAIDYRDANNVPITLILMRSINLGSQGITLHEKDMLAGMNNQVSITSDNTVGTMINIDGSNVTIKDLTIIGTGASRVAVNIGTPSPRTNNNYHNVVIQNCEFVPTGIMISNQCNFPIMVRGCRISTLGSSPYTFIRNMGSVVMSDCFFKTSNMYMFSLTLLFPDYPEKTKSIIVTNSYIENNVGGGGSIFDGFQDYGQVNIRNCIFKLTGGGDFWFLPSGGYNQSYFTVSDCTVLGTGTFDPFNGGAATGDMIVNFENNSIDTGFSYTALPVGASAGKVRYRNNYQLGVAGVRSAITDFTS